MSGWYLDHALTTAEIDLPPSLSPSFDTFLFLAVDWHVFRSFMMFCQMSCFKPCVWVGRHTCTSTTKSISSGETILFTTLETDEVVAFWLHSGSCSMINLCLGYYLKRNFGPMVPRSSKCVWDFQRIMDLSRYSSKLIPCLLTFLMFELLLTLVVTWCVSEFQKRSSWDSFIHQKLKALIPWRYSSTCLT